MKQLSTIIALAALTFALPTASFAAKKAAPAGTPAAGEPAAASTKPIPLYAEVTTIDEAGKSFTHKNKDGKEVKFVLTDKTEIKQKGAAAEFKDIKVGDWVSGLRVKKSDTEYDVLKITKFGPKEEKKAEGAKEEKKGEAPKAAATPKAS